MQFCDTIKKYPVRAAFVEALFIQEGALAVQEQKKNKKKNKKENKKESETIVYDKSRIESLVIPLVAALPTLVIFLHDHFDHKETNSDFNHDILRALESSKNLKVIATILKFNDVDHTIHALSFSTLTSLTIEDSALWEPPDDRSPFPSPTPPVLPYLKTLRLFNVDFGMIRYICSRQMPALANLSVDVVVDRMQCPECPPMIIIEPALRAFGKTLLNLDLLGYNMLTFDMVFVLNSCPALTSLSFHIDWQFSEGTHDLRHEQIEKIGIHGTTFLVLAGPHERFTSVPDQDEIDNAAANIRWFSTSNFPSLKVVQATCPSLVTRYVARGGRSAVDEGKSPGFLDLVARCEPEGIRFEDCTGGLFGQVPFPVKKGSQRV